MIIKSVSYKEFRQEFIDEGLFDDFGEQGLHLLYTYLGDTSLNQYVFFNIKDIVSKYYYVKAEDYSKEDDLDIVADFEYGYLVRKGEIF
jgi:hypothetical protein